MNTNKTVTYDIVAGPNKDALFDSCKYACSETSKVVVDFTVALGYTMPKNDPGCAYIKMPITDIKINGIEHEDGSGESFILHGYCRADLNCFTSNKVEYKPYRFEAYYSSKRREGWISFSK